MERLEMNKSVSQIMMYAPFKNKFKLGLYHIMFQLFLKMKWIAVTVGKWI